MKEEIVDLSLIVLNFNGRQWLEKLLPSLRNNYLSQTNHRVEVVVVDNNSTDLSLDYLNTQSWIKIIQSEKNGGFAFGNNLALKENRARYVMLLNNDTELLEKESNLDQLIDYMDQHEEVGMITPKVELTNGTIDPACHRGEPTLWTAFTYLIGLEKLFPKSSHFAKYHQGYKNLSSTHIIDACTGAAMLIRRSAMDKVGLLDERFFMYAEDLDWCKRFREAGFLVVFNPNIKIVHHKKQSGIGKGHRANTSYWFYHTMLQYYDKHYQKQHPKIVRWFLKIVVTTLEKHTH